MLLETPLTIKSSTRVFSFLFLFLFFFLPSTWDRTTVMFTSLFYLDIDCLDCLDIGNNSAIVNQKWCFDCPSRRNFTLGNHCAINNEIQHSKVNKTSNCIKESLEGNKVLCSMFLFDSFVYELMRIKQESLDSVRNVVTCIFRSLVLFKKL